LSAGRLVLVRVLGWGSQLLLLGCCRSGMLVYLAHPAGALCGLDLLPPYAGVLRLGVAVEYLAPRAGGVTLLECPALRSGALCRRIGIVHYAPRAGALQSYVALGYSSHRPGPCGCLSCSARPAGAVHVVILLGHLVPCGGALAWLALRLRTLVDDWDHVVASCAPLAVPELSTCWYCLCVLVLMLVPWLALLLVLSA
jgi:hypothetical protein